MSPTSLPQLLHTNIPFRGLDQARRSAMSNPFDGELLSTIIKLAKAEAYEQLNDPYDREIGIYLQLDLRDRSKRGGRYLGEPPNAPGINNDNREGEYKLWDEENLDVFFKTDGNPTAARALLLAMKGYHNIGERFIVYMGFTGIIDQGKYLWIVTLMEVH